MRFSWAWATAAALVLWFVVMKLGQPGAAVLVPVFARVGLGWLLFGMALVCGFFALGPLSGWTRRIAGGSWVLLTLLWGFCVLAVIFVMIRVAPVEDAGGQRWLVVHRSDFGPPEGAKDTFLYRCGSWTPWCRLCDARASFFEPIPWKADGVLIWDDPPAGCELAPAAGR